jgi:hypothetical protein
MSTVANSPCRDEDEPLDEPLMDLDGDDDDDDDYASKLIGTGTGTTSASSCAPATPSVLSQPSGLPITAIAGLTHDELRRNEEFMKYVRIVDALLATSKRTFFFSFLSIPR